MAKRTLSEILSTFPEERQERIAARAEEIELEEATLGAIREKLGISQAELASILEVQQPAVSKLERRDNWRLGTLRAIVAALGGEIDIIIRVPDRAPVLLSGYEMKNREEQGEERP